MNKFVTLIAVAVFVFPYASYGAFSRDLSVGARGSDVRELQSLLAGDSALYPEGVVSGYFGILTKAAVIRFQKRHGITPSAGFVGPRTRAKLDELSARPGAGIAELEAKLEELQELLKAMQAGLFAETGTVTLAASTTAPVVSDTAPPLFVGSVTASTSAVSLDSPFGERGGVAVALRWQADEDATLRSLVCDPEILADGAGSYWAKRGGDYRCAVTIEDASKNPSSTSVSFSVPGWMAASGSAAAALTESSAKLGNISVANNTATSAVVFRVNLEINDALDAPNSRNKNYKLILRKGPETSDDTLTRQDEYLHSQYPGVGKYHIRFTSFYAGVSLAPGETRNFGLWIEAMTGPLYGGYLKFKVIGIETIPAAALIGAPEYNFSK